jgi:hypothetical protein
MSEKANNGMVSDAITSALHAISLRKVGTGRVLGKGRNKNQNSQKESGPFIFVCS